MRGIRVPAVALGIALIATTSGAGAAPPRPTLYFLGSSGRTLVPVVRVSAPKTPRAALVALVAGPNAAETAAGDKSAFPAATRFSGAVFAGSVATVNFGGSGLAALRTIPRLRVIGSVTYTLTSFSTIKTVRFRLNGARWGVYNHAGRIIRNYQRGTLTHPWLPACAPEDGCFAP